MHHFPIYLHNTAEPHPVLSCALLRLPMVISVAASSIQPYHLLTFSRTEGGFVRRSQPYNCPYPTAPQRPAGDVSGEGDGSFTRLLPESLPQRPVWEALVQKIAPATTTAPRHRYSPWTPKGSLKGILKERNYIKKISCYHFGNN